MNSAPVQLLPIENGDGYKASLKKPEPAEAEGKRFEEVFKEKSADSETAVNETEQDSGKVEQAGKTDKAEKNEKGRTKTETASDNGKTVKDDAEDGVRKAAGDLKKQLGSKKTAEKETLSDDAGSDKSGIKEAFGKVTEKNAVKKKADTTAVAEASEDAAAETGFAGIFSAPTELKFDNKMSSGETTVKIAENGKSNLAGKLKSAAEKANSIEPSIEFAGAVSKASIQKNSTAAGGKNSSGKSGKLKVVDARRAAGSSKSAELKFSAAGGNSGLSSADTDFAGKIQEIGGFDGSSDLFKSDAKTSDIKNLQYSVLSQLKEELNSQIVKQAGIVVKGDGTGEIKLVMKPESLGKVRIQLSMNDNHIAGRIIVENNIVREIFESNLENLYKAFGAEGFENGGLEVSVQGQGRNADGNNGRRNGRGLNSRAVQVMEEAVPEIVNTEWRNSTVNMVV